MHFFHPPQSLPHPNSCPIIPSRIPNLFQHTHYHCRPDLIAFLRSLQFYHLRGVRTIATCLTSYLIYLCTCTRARPDIYTTVWTPQTQPFVATQLLRSNLSFLDSTSTQQKNPGIFVPLISGLTSYTLTLPRLENCPITISR